MDGESDDGAEPQDFESCPHVVTPLKNHKVPKRKTKLWSQKDEDLVMSCLRNVVYPQDAYERLFKAKGFSLRQVQNKFTATRAVLTSLGPVQPDREELGMMPSGPSPDVDCDASDLHQVEQARRKQAWLDQVTVLSQTRQSLSRSALGSRSPLMRAPTRLRRRGHVTG